MDESEITPLDPPAETPEPPPADPAPLEPEPVRTPLTPQLLATMAHAKLGPLVKKKITEAEVRAAIDRLDFTDLCPDWRIPRLLITRLRFTGIKRLAGKEPAAINYDQAFQPGVNVILVKKNGAGKSSILKTIKFALTGDDTEYDEGVRSWIENIWLHFKLDEHEYTMLLAQREGVWQGYLSDKDELRTIELALQDVVHRNNHLVGTKAIQQALANFFFNHYSLSALCWTRKNPHDESQISQCEASWRTYFQALRIRDDDHKYLLCGPDPAVAHQDNLLFTTFLGLQLAEPMNKISVEVGLIEKSKEAIDERATELQAKRTGLEEELKTAKKKIADIEARQTARMDAFLTGGAAVQLAKIDLGRQKFDAELVECQERLKSLNSEAQRLRADAQRLRTLIQLKRLFTGLDVTMCPRCAKPVSEHAIGRESTSFECRLCSEPVAGASSEDAAQMEARAQDFLHRADGVQKLHTETARRLAELQAEKEKEA